MANYAIEYLDDGSTARVIHLLPGNDGVRIEWKTEINRNITSTGIIENVVQNTLRYVTFDCYFQKAVFHQLETFMSFAQQGRPFTFIKDSTAGTKSVLLSDTAAPASSLITTDTALDPVDFSAGETIIIRDIYGTKWEINEVDAIVGDDQIDLVSTTQHDYEAGAIINSYYYFDSLYLMDEQFDPDRDGAFWHHTFNCVEVRSGS